MTSCYFQISVCLQIIVSSMVWPCVLKKNAGEANDVMLQLLMMSTGSYFLVVFDGCVYKGCSLVVSMFHCIIIDERKQFK